jgi:hypothetical protein
LVAATQVALTGCCSITHLKGKIIMKKLLTYTLVLTTLLFTHYALAYEDSLGEQACKKPRFHSFSLPEYKNPEKLEVPANADFSFTTSNWLDPATLKLRIKNKSLMFTIEDKKSFFLVTGKIPAEYTGQFVRIDVIANALLGCKGLDGWLIKVANK